MQEETKTIAENGIETLNIKETSNLSSANINVNEIDKETEQKLRGDAIGDTLYSESFVAKTLLKCKDFEWTESFENDLCFLWDMTVEKDVCEYLFKVSYPSIVCDCIQKYDENRFTEILIGILANMLCAEDCVKEIATEEIDIVVNLIMVDDPLILIQVMRFLKGLMYAFDSLECITEKFMQQISFILMNSMNKELLVITMENLSKLLMYFSLEDCLLENLLESSLVAYQVLMNMNDSKELDLEITENCSILRCFVQIVENLCVRVDKWELTKSKQMFSDIVLEIFKYCGKENNFVVAMEEIQVHFEAFATIFPMFEINYVTELFLITLKIFNLFLTNSCSFDGILKIFMYLTIIGDVQQMFEDLKLLEEIDVLKCLKTIKTANIKTKSNYKYNFDKLYEMFDDEI